MRNGRLALLPIALLTAAMSLLLLAPAALAADSTVSLGATLTGGEEVPGPGDEDGEGTAAIVLDHAKGEVCWALEVEGIDLAATAAHIHEGAEGEAGDIVVPLSAPDGDGMAAGCAEADSAVLDAIAEDPAGYYVNVHTSLFPQGAVRGNLERVTVPDTATSARQAAPFTRVLVLVLLGLGAVVVGVGGSVAVARRRI